MKTLRQHMLVLGALLGAAGLFAQGATKTAAPDPNDHDDLGFTPGLLVRNFTDTTSGGTITVTWMWTGSGTTSTGKPCEVYTCSIHQSVDSVNGLGYSLYNLEIQGRRWAVELVNPPANVVFKSGPSATVATTTVNGDTIVTIPAAKNGPWNSPETAPDRPNDKRIGFIKITGNDVTLTVRSMRLRHGNPMPFKNGMGILSSHDNTPPGGWGGSEN